MASRLATTLGLPSLPTLIPRSSAVSKSVVCILVLECVVYTGVAQGSPLGVEIYRRLDLLECFRHFETLERVYGVCKPLFDSQKSGLYTFGETSIR